MSGTGFHPLSEGDSRINTRHRGTTKGEEDSWECPHREFGWSHSFWIILVAAILLGGLIYCNIVYVGTLNLYIWTNRPNTAPTHTDIWPTSAIYKVNIYSDSLDLTTNCEDIYVPDYKRICYNPTPFYKRMEIAMGMILFVWSCLFPFVKIVLSLCFWFFPCPRSYRAWIMFAKVQIGRWSLIDLYFLMFWTFQFGSLSQNLYMTPYLKITDLYLHIDICFKYSPVFTVFCICQLGSLALSHFTMTLVERLHNPGYEVHRSDNPITFFCCGPRKVSDNHLVQPYEVDTNDSLASYSVKNDIIQEAWTCPNFWFVRGRLPYIVVLAALIANVAVMWYALFHTRSFTLGFKGTFVDKIPDLASVQDFTIWDVIQKLSDTACGNAKPVAAIAFLTIILVPLLSSISLATYWLILPIRAVPDNVKYFVRSAASMLSVYSALDVLFCAQYFTMYYFPEIFFSILEAFVGRTDTFKRDFLYAISDNGPSYYMILGCAVTHWCLMTHCLTVPFKQENLHKLGLFSREGFLKDVE